MDALLNDAELLERSVSEPALFGAVFERHRVTVRRYVVRRVGVTDGEDLAAEVFVRAFRSRGPASGLSTAARCHGSWASRTM